MIVKIRVEIKGSADAPIELSNVQSLVIYDDFQQPVGVYAEREGTSGRPTVLHASIPSDDVKKYLQELGLELRTSVNVKVVPPAPRIVTPSPVRA